MDQHPSPLAPDAPKSLFSVGQIVITANALNALHRPSVDDALLRHTRGDWGVVPAEDAEQNVQALRHGGRLFSAYIDSTGTRFWIITEVDRWATTVLLPEDY